MQAKEFNYSKLIYKNIYNQEYISGATRLHGFNLLRTEFIQSKYC